MTRLADRIVGRIADKVSFGLLYRDDVMIQFIYLPDAAKWKVRSDSRWARVETEVDHLYIDCKVSILIGPGFDVKIKDGVTIVGYWDGDTGEEMEEAYGSDDDDEGDDE
mgnify:CR=1 FL=1